MAQMLLRHKLKKRKIKWWDVASRGIHAEVGSSMSLNSALALKDAGIEIVAFKPKQLTQKLIEASEVVITMTSSQKQMLEGCGNIVCIKDVCGFEVPDPYGGSLELYIKTRDALDCACDKIIEKFILNKEIL